MHQVIIVQCLLSLERANALLPMEVERIRAWRSTYSPEYLQRCRSINRTEGGKWLPITWLDTDRGFKWRLTKEEADAKQAAKATAAAAKASREVEQGLEAEQGLQALRLFLLDTDLASALAKASEDDKLELPFDLSPDQQGFVELKGSKMAIGRSGTGKTTTIFKML